MSKPKPGRPTIPPADRRVTLAVRVDPFTRNVIKDTSKALGISQGELVDRMAKRCCEVRLSS